MEQNRGYYAYFFCVILRTEFVNMNEYTIQLTWAEEAQVWVAINDEIPIVLESGSLDALIERVKTATPELLELNGKEHTNIHLHFKAERLAVVS